ncbi:MAG: Hpt domain-containing protein [Actinobacteria bacterium]|nr:Hpt domain-containing protein [Actinomycetota bacterium]
MAPIDPLWINDRTLTHDGAGTLESDLGPEVYQELLAGFLSHLTSQVADLENAARIGGVPAARSVAHQIKSIASSFRAVHLNELTDHLLRLDGDEGELLESLVHAIDREVSQLQAG